MTPESLKAWRDRMHWSQAKTAKQLGISANGYGAYEHGTPLTDQHTPRKIPKYIALACAAITHRLEPEK